jgi:hypothetical protein
MRLLEWPHLSVDEVGQGRTEFEQLLRRVQAYNPQADVQLIRRAYEYSARMHAEQKGLRLIVMPSLALVAAPAPPMGCQLAFP